MTTSSDGRKARTSGGARRSTGESGKAPAKVAAKAKVKARVKAKGKAPTGGKRRPRANVARYGFDGPIDDNVKLPARHGGQHTPAPPADYPGAIGFVRAASYGAVSASSPRTITRIVIHITDGRAKDCRRTAEFFRSGETSASAHYIVGQDGTVIQCVREKDVAYHAHEANQGSIGIEHCARTRRELGASDDGMAATEAQYLASARLVYSLCARYDLPLHISWLADATRRTDGPVLGHHEADSKTTHTNCPEGKSGATVAWDWAKYKAAMKQIHAAIG